MGRPPFRVIKVALCNEMFEGRPMAEACLAANRWGYHGIEIVPFTLARSAKDVAFEQSKEVRQIIKDNGLEIVGPTGHGWFSKLIALLKT